MVKYKFLFLKKCGRLNLRVVVSLGNNGGKTSMVTCEKRKGVVFHYGIFEKVTYIFGIGFVV